MHGCISMNSRHIATDAQHPQCMTPIIQSITKLFGISHTFCETRRVTQPTIGTSMSARPSFCLRAFLAAALPCRQGSRSKQSSQQCSNHGPDVSHHVCFRPAQIKGLTVVLCRQHKAVLGKISRVSVCLAWITGKKTFMHPVPYCHALHTVLNHIAS